MYPPSVGGYAVRGRGYLHGFKHDDIVGNKFTQRFNLFIGSLWYAKNKNATINQVVSAIAWWRLEWPLAIDTGLRPTDTIGEGDIGG
jgi:hypothetical protein